jgi:hypothetical protein
MANLLQPLQILGGQVLPEFFATFYWDVPTTTPCQLDQS